MAPLLPSPAPKSPSAPVGPQHAGWIWGAVKGQRRPSTAGPFPCTATLQVPRWRAHRTGWQRAGSSWLKPRPKLQRCDATLPREVVWRKFQPQFCLLSPNEPMPCSHPPWVQAEGQRVTCDTQPHCWQEMKSFVLLDVNPRPSANPEAIRLWTCVSLCPYGQGQHKPPTEPTPAAQPGATCTTAAASKEAAGEGESKENATCLVNIRSWHKPIYPGWNSTLNLPHGGRANSLLSIYRLEKKFHQLDTPIPQQACVPVFQL